MSRRTVVVAINGRESGATVTLDVTPAQYRFLTDLAQQLDAAADGDDLAPYMDVNPVRVNS